MPPYQQIVDRLGLVPLVPEGGYFARTWTGMTPIEGNSPNGTAIYFLLTPETFSAFHKLKADELWHFYAGDAVEHWQLRANSAAVRTTMGPDVLASDTPQLLVPANTWQAARLDPARHATHGWALLGCTMVPGWRDDDFSLGGRDELTRKFPANVSIVRSLTRA